MERDIHRLNSFNNRIGGENMNEIIKLSNTTLVVTFRCNLKCKLYYSNPKPHWSLSQLKLYTDKYFEIVDYVEKMTISGGEPLLHPDLGKLVEYLCTYGDRIHEDDLGKTVSLFITG